MRLFLALNLPKKERQRIERAARPLREQDLPVRWVDLDNFHITLKFLGDVRPERVESVQEIMERVAASTVPFQATVDGFGAFPTIRKPSVLWARVGATPELRCLKQDLEWALAELGFEKETRAFHPHLTLGRASGGGGAGAFRGLDELTASLEVESQFTVRTVDLMRSQTGRNGPRYSVLHKARLSGEG
ncbi:MAG: RNA 2',3'-cyclic phosphodiesterase [Gemmatimonadales bacterium]|nr:MAG: RNA 2',3'-cyclic phosphodiesterase [Gemmatimonadales bacterium]